MSKSLNLLATSKQLTLLNITNMSYRMRIQDENEWKIDFSTIYKYYKSQVILFE